jgi:acyl dehydratase
VRVLSEPPGTISLYARAAAGALRALPGASRVPLVGGGGDAIPDEELVLDEVGAEAGRVADYCRACGFTLTNHLPPTYPHILAFPLHLALLTDSRMPFPALGLVHVANRITQHRPVEVGESMSLSVRATQLEPHRSGRQFSLISEARVGDELVWDSASTTLRRGGGEGGDSPKGSRADPGPEVRAEDVRAAAEWRLPEGLGRRYAAVSGDRNPIHMHSLTARAFGFRRAIAHGMWTKARCLAALEGHLPDDFTVEVRFRRPIELPGKVVFASEEEDGTIAFGVRGAADGTPHLEGAVSPRSTAGGPVAGASESGR